MKKDFLYTYYRQVCAAFAAFLLFFCVAPSAFAVQMIVTPNNVPLSGEYSILFTCDSSFAVFNSDTGEQVDSADVCNQTWANYAQPPGHYTAVEFSNADPNGGSGSTAGFTLTDMRNDPQYDGPAGEANFTIYDDTPHYSENGTPPLDVPQIVYDGEGFVPGCGLGISFFQVIGTDEPPVSCGIGTTLPIEQPTAIYEIQALDRNMAYVPPSVFVTSVNTHLALHFHSFNPVVTILSVLKDLLFSHPFPFNYQVTDQNDTGTVAEQQAGGLGPKPVSLFYSDKNFDWYDGVTVDAKDKTLVERNLPAAGPYAFSVKNLIPGNLYRIIVDAIDLSGKLGENVSDFFGVDLTPPVFTVKTDPPVVKGGTVQITVTASENLAATPTVAVMQQGGNAVPVLVSGSGDTYSGIYTVLSGYDGTAHIAVSGIDTAGNVGTTTVAGGIFSVGINPPPKPKLALDAKVVTANGTIDVLGTVRTDTEAVLSINGSIASTTKPDTKGNFAFYGVILDKTKNQGTNYISVAARDPLGAVGESANAQVKYNIPPAVSITDPIDHTLLPSQAEITARGTDENGDTLTYTYQIVPFAVFNAAASSTVPWITIADNTVNNFTYDTGEQDDGEYMIRVIAHDGFADAASLPVDVSIKNTAPFFRFEDGRKTVTNSATATIVGRAIIPDSIAGSPTVAALYYSTNNGVKWNPIAFAAAGSSREQKFSVTISGLAEGATRVLFRMKDSRNIFGRGTHTVIVDKTPPLAPVLSTPHADALITNDDDADSRQPGAQIGISGRAEADSIVTLSIGSTTQTTRALPTGDFSFASVSLLAKGRQALMLTAMDEAGNISRPTLVSVIYDNPPSIAFINPEPFGGIARASVLAWNITDPDNDVIEHVLVREHRAGGPFTTLLSDGAARGTYPFDASALSEGNDYELVISATDGIVPVTARANFSIDRTPPDMNSFTLRQTGSSTRVSFAGSGTASDAVSGIAFVEYAIEPDGGDRTDWYTGIITRGLHASNAAFTLNYPKFLPDGLYTVFVRAVDAAGNTSDPLSARLHIDTTAPRIGSFFAKYAGADLIADTDGTLELFAESTSTFAVSIESDTVDATVFIGEKPFPLVRDIASGLWQGSIRAGTGPEPIFVSAIDSLGNATRKKHIGSITPVTIGRVADTSGDPISDASLTIFKQNPDTLEYDRFALPGGASIATNAEGEYGFVLPAGAYRLVVQKSGYRTETSLISLAKTELVHDSFTLEPISGILRIINSILDFLRY